MNENGFRTFLKTRNIGEIKILAMVSFIQQIESRLKELVPVWTLEDINNNSGQAIVNDLIDRGENSLENLQTILYYSIFIKNHALYLLLLQHLDGYEAINNLHANLAEMVGEDLRDVIFDEMPLPPLGLSAEEKSMYAYRIINRLEEIFDKGAVREILKDCLRDLPDSMYENNKSIFFEDCHGDIDCYLLKKGERFLKRLRNCRDSKLLFFGQEINDEVIALVEANKEIGQGVREGHII